jgi:uncharacterized protein YoxC
MTSLASAALHLALQATARTVDTIYVQTAPVAQGWFAKAVSIAGGLLTIAVVATAVILVPAMWNFRKTYKKTSKLLERIQGDVSPLIKHAHSIVDNVDYISTAIRADVAKIQGTIQLANERLQDAIDTTERRVNEFNALLTVVQSEAEGAFVSTAAAVRGIREGASEFARGSGPELASVEFDDDGLEAVEDDLETDDYGNDDSPESDDRSDATRAPRVIRRNRTRG